MRKMSFTESSLSSHVGSLVCAFALVGIEDALAETEEVGGDFHQFIWVDVFDGALERKLESGWEFHCVVFSGGADVIEFFGLHRVDGKIICAGVFSDDHASVNFLGRVDEEGATAFESGETVGSCGTGVHGDEGTCLAGDDVTSPRLIFVEEVRHDAVT